MFLICLLQKTDKEKLILLYSQLIMCLFYEYSGNITFTADEMSILSVNLNYINLDDANCYEDDPKIIIHIRHLVWHNKFKQRETFKKIRKELMSAVWHSTRWWHWWILKDVKKENRK